VYELKQHKQFFDEECLGSLVQRKQAKMQWLQNPNQNNVDNLNNVKREANTHFSNKKKFLKAKIEERETNSKPKISGTCLGPSMTFRRLTSLELMK
jgi:hypothetical protein